MQSIKTMVFPVVMYGCDSWIIKKAERQKSDASELQCWRILLRVLGIQGDQISQSWGKSILNIHWKDWCWSWSSNTLATWWEELTHWKRPWGWERLKVGEGDDRGWDGWWHQWLDGLEFEQAPGVGDEQRSLARCSPWGPKEQDMTEQLNWTDIHNINPIHNQHKIKTHFTFFFHSLIVKEQHSPWRQDKMVTTD